MSLCLRWVESQLESDVTTEISAREAAILEAAMTAFSRYGFSRTKMDDIATAAGIARTALYKIYRNKEHIFRALAEQVHAGALDVATVRLDGTGAFQQRLADALIARDRHLLMIGHSGPHADEIAELYLSLAGDLATSYNDALVDVLTSAIDDACKAEQFQVPKTFASARDFAHLLRLALEGVKKEVKSADDFEALARQLIAAMAS